MKIFNNFYNPFREIFETETYPLARIYRTRTYVERLVDTHRIFTGNGLFFETGTFQTAKLERQNHLGIFDYLTFGIPFLFSRICQFGLEEDKLIRQFPHGTQARFPNKLGKTLINIAWLATYIARHVTASVFTLLASPIVALVSIATERKRKKLWEKVAAIEFITTEPVPGLKDKANAVRQKKLAHNKLQEEKGLPTVPVEDEYKQELSVRAELAFFEKDSSTGEIALGHIERYDGDLIRTPDNVRIDMGFELNRREIKLNLPKAFSHIAAEIKAPNVDMPASAQSFIELNIAHVTEKLEARGFFAKDGNRPIVNEHDPIDAPGVPQQGMGSNLN